MFEKVKEVILDTLSCEPEQITMEASLVDDLEEIRNSLLDNYLGDSKRVLYAAARSARMKFLDSTSQAREQSAFCYAAGSGLVLSAIQ